MKKPKQMWVGSSVCDVCNTECGDTLYDAVTKMGPWATMCKFCYREYGLGKLGTGLGQRYARDPESKFYFKMEG